MDTAEKFNFNKKALTLTEQLQKLQQRGLIINDYHKAIFLLEHISYYRLSGYWYPLLEDKEKHIFKLKSSFETAFSLYCFDKELRKLLVNEIEKIEISIRSKIAYTMSHTYGSFWYEDSNLFKDIDTHNSSLQKIKEVFEKSEEEFIRSFKKKYHNALPPSWMLVEIIPFGTISKLYQNLKSNKEKKNIANSFGLNEKVFSNWLHVMVYLRNICAHHSRLWNKVHTITAKNLKSPANAWINHINVQTNKTYYIICIIKYFLDTVNPNSSFKERLTHLLKKYPMVDIYGAIGFTKKWEDEQLWKNLRSL